MNIFRRILARYRLRCAGYCPRHLIQKLPASARYRREMSEVYTGKIISGDLIYTTCHTLDSIDPDPFCESCREEKAAREQERLVHALEILGGKLG